MRIEAYFKESGEKIKLLDVMVDVGDGRIRAVQDTDGEIYGSHLIDIIITD